MITMYVTYEGKAETKFDRDHWINVHLPLVREIWGPHGLLRTDGFFPSRDESGLIAICPCVFRDEAAMKAALADPGTKKVMDDVTKVTDVKPRQSVATRSDGGHRMVENKVIIVTGAGSGIGLATAIMLGRGGAKVVVSGRAADGLDAAVDAVRRAGGMAIAIPADVSIEAEIAGLVQRTVAEFGRLDDACNNAGVEMHNKSVPDLTAENWDQVFAIDVSGVFLCMRNEMRAMRATGGGAIVNMSSMNGLVAIPHATEYVAAKHAVIGATRGASSETRETGVRVNAVLPGLIETPMIDRLKDEPGFQDHYAAALERHSIGRFGKPDDVAYAVRWLLSDEASFVNGTILAVEGDCTAR